jgi:hypothetical protein
MASPGERPDRRVIDRKGMGMHAQSTTFLDGVEARIGATFNGRDFQLRLRATPRMTGEQPDRFVGDVRLGDEHVLTGPETAGRVSAIDASIRETERRFAHLLRTTP